MRVITHPDAASLGRAAAEEGAEVLRAAVAARGHAAAILATGASQFATLARLSELDLPWHRITLFHLDEYVGMTPDHPASFVRYLWDRFVRKLRLPPKAFHTIDGSAEPAGECRRLSGLIAEARVDVAFVGIGENGHLAFNDPPADFGTTAPYLVVELDEACRRQQLGEGWFPDLDAVPRTAVTMSVRQILAAGRVVCSVPDARKAAAVRAAVAGPVTPDAPASALQTHPDCSLHLDPPSAALLP